MRLLLLAPLLVCSSQASACTERRLRGLRPFFDRTSSSRDLLHGVWAIVASHDKCDNIAGLISQRPGRVSDLREGLARFHLRLQEGIWDTWASNGTDRRAQPTFTRLSEFIERLERNLLYMMEQGLEMLQDFIGSYPIVPQLRSVVMELFHTCEQWSPGEIKSALSSLICSPDISSPKNLDGWTLKHIQELQMLLDNKISLLDMQLVPEKLNATFIRLKKTLHDKAVVQAISNTITVSHEKLMTGQLPKVENFLSDLLNYLASEQFWSEKVRASLETSCHRKDEALDSFLEEKLHHLARGPVMVLSDFEENIDLTSWLDGLVDKVLTPVNWVLDGLEFGVNNRYPEQVDLGLGHLWKEEFLLRDQLGMDSLGDVADNNAFVGVGFLYVVANYVGLI